MKIGLFALLVGAWGFVSFGDVKLMSFNVCHCMGMDGKIDVARTAARIKAENPDCAVCRRSTSDHAPVVVTLAPAAKVAVDFARGKWNRADWTVVRNPRWNYLHDFEQFDDCIANETPGTKSVDWYSAMVYKRPVAAGESVTVRMSFDDRFAPGIILAPQLADGASGAKELRDHFEIIFFSGGLNVWQYRWRDGHYVITKPCFLECPFANRTPHDVTVRVTAKNVIGGGATRQLTVTCGDRIAGFRSDDLPEKFFVGVDANEGRCRFYAMNVVGGDF